MKSFISVDVYTQFTNMLFKIPVSKTHLEIYDPTSIPFTCCPQDPKVRVFRKTWDLNLLTREIRDDLLAATSKKFYNRYHPLHALHRPVDFFGTSPKKTQATISQAYISSDKPVGGESATALLGMCNSIYDNKFFNFWLWWLEVGKPLSHSLLHSNRDFCCHVFVIWFWPSQTLFSAREHESVLPVYVESEDIFSSWAPHDTLLCMQVVIGIYFNIQLFVQPLLLVDVELSSPLMTTITDQSL